MLIITFNMKAPYFLIKYILALFAILVLYNLFQDSYLLQYCMSCNTTEAASVGNLLLDDAINLNSHGRAIMSPLDQFEIRNLLSLDAPILGNLFISLTNIGLYLTIAAFISLTMSFLSTNYNKIVANS